MANTDFSGAFLDLAQLTNELATARAAAAASGRKFKLAITITGGGARGAYEGGVVEALTQAGLKPDLIVGTSVGALVSWGLFVDTLMPKRRTQIYAANHSQLWRDVGLNNNGATMLLNRPWVAEYLSKKTYADVSSEWRSITDDAKALRATIETSVATTFSTINASVVTLLNTAVPGLGTLLTTLETLGKAADTLTQAVALQTLSDAVTNLFNTLETLRNLAEGGASTASSQLTTLKNDFNTLVGIVEMAMNPVTAGGSLPAMVAFGNGLLNRYKNQSIAQIHATLRTTYDTALNTADNLRTQLDDLGSTVRNADLGTKTAAVIAAARSLTLVMPVPASVTTSLNTVVSTVNTLVAQLSRTVTSTGQLAGQLATDFTTLKTKLQSLYDLAHSRLGDLLADLNRQPDGKAGLNDHMLTLDPARTLILSRLRDTLIANFGNNPALPVKPSLMSVWRGTANATELIVTTTNLNASRMVLFGLMHPETVAALEAAELWTVDLARSTDNAPGTRAFASARPYRFFLADKPATDDVVLDAVITSSSIPIAFPPRRWRLSRQLQSGTRTVHQSSPRPGGPSVDITVPVLVEQKLEHLYVDGGVFDNSPLDIAALAGATHSISIELDPLVGDLVDDPGWVDQTSRYYDLGDIAGASFNAMLGGTLASNIRRAVQTNGRRADTDPAKFQLYRIAPRIPRDEIDPGSKNTRKRSIDTMDFDGAWVMQNGHPTCIMNVYDWFMQGFIDASGLVDTKLTADARFIDYTKPENNGFVRNAKPMGNKFWRASSVPTPPPSFHA